MAFNKERWKCEDTYDPNFDPLPESPGVYCIAGCFCYDLTNPDVGKYTVMYVGKSKNLKARVSRRHPAYIACLEWFDHVARFFLPFDESRIDSIEAKLIKRFQPALNRRGK